MNSRKGSFEIGQTLTSFSSMILCVIIVAIFLLFSYLGGLYQGKNAFESKPTVSYSSSAVLTETFLNDYVLVNGKERRVREILYEASVLEKADKEYTFLSEAVENHFNQFYSCAGRNSLLVGRSWIETTSTSDDSYDLPRYEAYIRYAFADSERGYSCPNDRGFYTSSISIGSERICVSVKEVASC